MKDSKVKILRNIDVKSSMFLKPSKESNYDDENSVDMQQTVNHIDEQILRAYDEGYRKGIHQGQEQGFQEGKRQGKVLGIEEGREDSLEQLNFLIQTLHHLSSELQSRKENLLNEIKPELIRFCLGICKKILGHELTLEKSYHAMLDHLFSKVGKMTKNQPIIVMVSKEDLGLLEGYEAKLRENWHQNTIQIQGDPSMPRGRCCLETPLGIVNFDIDRLIKNFESKVLEGD